MECMKPPSRIPNPYPTVPLISAFEKQPSMTEPSKAQQLGGTDGRGHSPAVRTTPEWGIP